MSDFPKEKTTDLVLKGWALLSGTVVHLPAVVFLYLLRGNRGEAGGMPACDVHPPTTHRSPPVLRATPLSRVDSRHTH